MRSVLYNVLRLHKYMGSIRYIRPDDSADGCGYCRELLRLLTGADLLDSPSETMVCIHQYLFLHPDFVFPKQSTLSLASLRFLRD